MSVRDIRWKIVIRIIVPIAFAAGAFVLSRRVGLQNLWERLRTIAGFAWSWSPPLLPSLLFAGIVVILLLWKLPAWQVARCTDLTDRDRFDRVNEARKTLAQILGGVLLLAGVYSSVQTLNLSARTADLSAKTLDLSREGQITDRFTKAIDQLGALDGKGRPNLEVRLGGIYALERIARDSERDDWTIMEVLTAYVREHTARKEGDQDSRKSPRTLTPTPAVTTPSAAEPTVIPVSPDEAKAIQAADTAYLAAEDAEQAPITALKQTPQFKALHNTEIKAQNVLEAAQRKSALVQVKPMGADIQAILTVLGRRERKYDKGSLDLKGVYIDGAELYLANLEGADLHGAHLSRADLEDADLLGANLAGSDLTRANLMDAALVRASLGETHLGGANLEVAQLGGANLTGADLTGALLSAADLRLADLTGAHFDGADLSGAYLDGTYLAWADLGAAHGLSQKQIDSAHGNKQTKLPPGLKRPESWAHYVPPLKVVN